MLHGLHGHAIQQSSSTGLPTGLQADVQSITRVPRVRNGLAMGLQFSLIQQCNVTRAQLNAMQCHTGSTQCNAMLHGLNGLHRLTMRHSSSTGSPSRCIICYTGSTGSQWTCSSASYNHVTSSMQCNITRAQRAPRAYQKLAELACYTGSTGSKRISIAFINISHYICHNFGYS